MMASSDTETLDVRRMLKVEGYEGRVNDILISGPPNPSSVVVYFGGDIQNLPEVMLSHRDNGRYVKWNLEATAGILAKKFTSSTIVIICPHRMELLTYSCYSNFVECNKFGVPKHKWNFNALAHLGSLLAHLEMSVQLKLKDVKLVGFSKGCVVLNQFLHEFHHYHVLVPDTEPPDIIKKISSMYWLDGGHSGGGNTWVISKPILESLAAKMIEIHIHVTPYQIRDDLRPWIGKEEKLFHTTLEKYQVVVHRVVHFDDNPPSLEHHFEVLASF